VPGGINTTKAPALPPELQHYLFRKPDRIDPQYETIGARLT